MSKRFERSDERNKGARGADGASNVMQLFGQMMMLPFTVFVYSLEMFVRTMRGMERVADEGMGVVAGETAQPRPDVPTSNLTNQAADSGGIQPPGTSPGNWNSLITQPETSKGGVGKAAETVPKENNKMSDKNLSDDMLKLVRYKILFVKRDYEVAFPEREELVPDNITGEAFTAWKIAEFIQRLDREDVPHNWAENNYPKGSADGKIHRLDEDDKKYLRVYFEVLDRYVREDANYDRDEVTVLREIRDVLKAKHTPTPTHSGPSATTKTGTHQA
ncbi:MAG: hypothetical protein LC754_14270 [Acidobacteria bacterium]|nr:hypothetical protein [Acidobacteriota bacterium]